MESLMERDNIFGKMEQSMLEIFKMDWEKVKEVGLVRTTINIQEILVQTEKMDWVNLYGLTEIPTKENFVKIWEKGMAKWFGMTVAFIRANGKEDYQMEEVKNKLI
jgi:hypothetical protein